MNKTVENCWKEHFGVVSQLKVNIKQVLFSLDANKC